MRGPTLLLALCLFSARQILAENKEGKSFYKPFAGKCPTKRGDSDEKWTELPHLCVSLSDEKLDHDTAEERCSRGNKHSRLLTVGSLRKFQQVEMSYLTKDDSGEDANGPFWVDARYQGSGKWTPRRGKRAVRFEYFPTFDPHRAHEGEALVWDPVESRLRAAHPGEKFRYICEMRKARVERCKGKPECTNRGDCIEGECYCDYPYLGHVCQHTGCTEPCTGRQACDLSDGKCKCPPYLTGEDCSTCEIARARNDGSLVCYKFGPAGVSYAAALAYCKSLSMRLPEITTDAHETHMEQLLSTGKYWLGANDFGHPDKYYWNSGIEVDPYDNWAGALGPPNTGASVDCVKMDSLGTWGNVACPAAKAYVCQIPWAIAPSSLNLSCITPMKDPCYQFVKTPMLNYDAAAQDCLAKGGTLAEIKSAAENTFVKGLMTANAVTTGVWIGLKRAGSDYFYQDGTIFSSQLHFAANEPTVPSNGQDCLAFDGAADHWTNEACSGPFNTICESPPFPS